MGYFFASNFSEFVMGCKHGNKYLLLRSDLVAPEIKKIHDSLDPSRSISTFFYPNAPILKSHAKNKFNTNFILEDKIHSIFDKHIFAKYANFKMSDLKIPKNDILDFITSCLTIYLFDSEDITFEINQGQDILRIAKKPNKISRLFSTRETGDTLALTQLKSIKDVEISEKGLNFLLNRGNIFINKTTCYT